MQSSNLLFYLAIEVGIEVGVEESIVNAQIWSAV
jgi:hypothetical protein